MNYKMWDINGNEISHHNLQDKTPWCEHGASWEEVFVKKFGKQLDLAINPEKKLNKYAPDLLNIKKNIRADLKTQSTPFFKARIYGCDPHFAVVFNLKDRHRYETLYPEIDIYFWIDWVAVKFEMKGVVTEVTPLTGVWKIAFKDLLTLLDKAPVHEYVRRKNDTKGNAKASYVLSIDDPAFQKILV